MRVAMIIGAERADDHGERALVRADPRRLAADRAVIAVARPVLGGMHGVADEDDLAAHSRVGRRPERIEAVEADHLGGDARGRRRAAMAEGGDGQLLRDRGATISAVSAPRTQVGIRYSSTWTLRKPSAFSLATAQVRARASASLPASRGPTSVVRPSMMSSATSSLSAASRSRSAWIGILGERGRGQREAEQKGEGEEEPVHAAALADNGAGAKARIRHTGRKPVMTLAAPAH